MRLPDGTILMHGRAPYDPAKAHEYYLRTRQLKGRRKGSGYTVRLDGGKTVQLSERQLIEQRAYAAKRVSEIKNRLNELGTKLRKMVADANRTSKKGKPTAAEKSKAARESKQYREKHKQELATKRSRASKTESAKSKSKKDSVAELEHKITQVKNNLRTAVAKQRALASATRNG